MKVLYYLSILLLLAGFARGGTSCPAAPVYAENYDSIFWSSSCTGSTITFSSTLFDSLPFPSYIMWNFGYPAAGIYNTAGVQSPTMNYPVAGKYCITLTVVNAGTNDTVVLKDSITVGAPLTYSWGPDQYLCGNATYTLTAPVVAGAKYMWNNTGGTPDTTNTLVVTTSGVYTVSINGCWVSDSIGVFISDSPNLNLGANHIMCDSANLTLNATTMNGHYVWTLNGTLVPDTMGQLLTHNPGGEYKVVTTVPGCGVFADSANITYNSPIGPVLNLEPDTNLCPGQIDTINASIPGATAYNWSTGSADSMIFVSAAGAYWVFVTYNNQCQITDTMLVAIYPTPQLDFHDTSICQGSTLIVAADFGTGTYTWTATPAQRNDQNSTNQASYFVYDAGTFTVTAQIGQCVYKDSITVTFDDSLRVHLPLDTSACNGSDFTLTVLGNPDTVTWQDGLQALSHPVPQPGGTYTAIAKNGCGADTLNSVVTFGECACNLLLPDAFTPNGDGINDIFKPLNFCKMSQYSLQIYNRYGTLVYHSEDPETGWSGNYLGLAATPGNYVWQVLYTNEGQTRPTLKKGNVVLIR